MRMRSEHQNFTEDEKFSYQFDTACQLLAQKHNISLSEASGYIEKTISQLR